MVRVSRAGHTFHERWAARRALQLVFPQDDLHSIVVEGLSPTEILKLGQKAEDIADLTLFYGNGETFDTCSAQQVLQFKYKEAADPVTSSYLKKTVKKFAATLKELRAHVSEEEVTKKLSFGFVTNAEFSDDLWDAITCLKYGGTPQTTSGKSQLKYLNIWCKEEKIKARELFPLIEFRASTLDLPAQNRSLRRTVSDWSGHSSGLAAIRLLALVELVREKAQIEGQGNNSIKREDVLNALECDEDQLFPADTQFVDVGEVIERSALNETSNEIKASSQPIFLHADGGVGKTVFIQSLAAHLKDTYEVVVFDCFGGGAYRSEAQARHMAKVGLLQIVNELAVRGLCDPLLPTDNDEQGLIKLARKRLTQASETVKEQTSLYGVLIVLDAADNAQLEADARDEAAFPRLLLSSLSAEPIDDVKLLLTARPHRMESVIGRSQPKRLKLEPFTQEETRRFLEARRNNISEVDFLTAMARSRGNARVLEYLVESWDTNVSGDAPKTEISVEELISQKCEKIFGDLHTAGWSDSEVREFFAALSLLPPPIPLTELAKALDWSDSHVNSAASDLAPMLELVRHGAIFRDEPTETYIKEHYASEVSAQQSIAERLQAQQAESIYAAEALPHFLVVIGDSQRAYQLAKSDEFPSVIETEYGRRRLRLARLYAAFSLATREKDFDRVLRLTMQLSQAASANARGDQFIRRSPALATVLGDSDASRRLFNDRSGWRGARDARLTIAYCFSDELNEAKIYQSRAIGWINWYLGRDEDTSNFDHARLEAQDVAAIMFLSALENDFFAFNRNMQIWNFRFSLQVIGELIHLCEQHELANRSQALQNLATFAASKRCLSLALHIGFLSRSHILSRKQRKSVSRAASILAHRHKKKIPQDNSDYEKELQGDVVSAAMNALIANSKQSAKRVLGVYHHRRPSSYDFSERHGMNRIWRPVQSACVKAWAAGERLSFQHLLPNDVKATRSAKQITTEAELGKFLDDLEVTVGNRSGRKSRKSKKEKQYSRHEREDIVNGSACVLALVKPIENSILSGTPLSESDLADFLQIWKSALRPDVHWRAETGRDNVARHVGIGLAFILLQNCEVVEEDKAEELVEIIDQNRFSLHDKLNILALLARRENLSDFTGAYAAKVSADIVKDDYIEQRGESCRNLAAWLIPLSIGEAQSYYAQGLAQLDQMGGDDFDLIYSVLHYAAEQPGGFVKPELSHRLMNLCQTIFQHEPSKFGWTLFGRACASSVGFAAVYKLVRWYDQDVVDFSYGLPQLVCFLAKNGHLDPRRAAVILTICKDHGWHEWQIGNGLRDLLSVADPSDRAAIFSLIVEKLDQEHNTGGWPGLWGSLLDCIDAFDGIDDDVCRSALKEKYDSAQRRRDIENAEYSHTGGSTDYKIGDVDQKKDEAESEVSFAAILANCNPISATVIDSALQDIEALDGLAFDNRKRLFEELRENCPYDQRVKFLESLCETTELEFDRTLDLVVECFEAWRGTSMHVANCGRDIITRLFSFKGSELFELRYSGISRQIFRLSELSDDAKFVLQTVLETISRERLELSGDEWLQLATSLSGHSSASASLEAMEDLLSSSAANVGDEIGEGEFCSAFAGQDNPQQVIAEIVWHLLGDSDAFVRWNAARSLKAFLDLGLTEDVERLLERFDVDVNPSLASENHEFCFLNAQQWLLMGLARASLQNGTKLEPLKPKIWALAKRTDIHIINKLHIARILGNIERDQAMSPELARLWAEIEYPPYGIAERSGWPDNADRRIDFRFDYDFMEHKISNLARLFWISDNEASDWVAEEITKRWPRVKDMSDFPGRARYRGDERYETYREHIQRHACISAATTLSKNMSVARQSYDWEGFNPWDEFIKRYDVSFSDGTWLADHKDRVPAQALQHLLGERKGSTETLIDNESLFKKVGYSEGQEFLPLYGSWKSPDDVYVSLNSALVKKQGAVGQCSAIAKWPDHELWLPTFASDGRIDRRSRKVSIDPLIWVPEVYPFGIDERDKWASRGAITRPRLGLLFDKLLKLTPDDDGRNWYDDAGRLALKSHVWGEWRMDSDARGTRYQDEGSLLWAEREWLDGALKLCKRSLVLTLDYSKYKSSRSYDESSGVRAKYIGLKRRGEDTRFWFAKTASNPVY